MIVANLLFFRSMQCCFANLHFQGICLWRASALNEERKYDRVVVSRFFCFICFECYYFCLEWIKIKPYYTNKAQSFFTDFFFSLDSCFLLKEASCAAYWDLGASLLIYSSPLFASLILLCKSALILPGRYSLSHEKKSWRRLYIFLKPRSMKVRNFKLTCWYASF